MMDSINYPRWKLYRPTAIATLQILTLNLTFRVYDRGMWPRGGVVGKWVSPTEIFPLSLPPATCYYTIMLWQKKDGFAPQPGLNLRPPEPPTCHLCGVEFEPMTPKMTSVAGEVHHGCYDKYYRVVSKCCTHATPAEDGSFFSFMHRKYGCPDEGAKWPRAAQELGFE